MKERVSQREKASKAYRLPKQGVFLDDKRDCAVQQRKMLQQIESVQLKHESGCGCVGCMAQKIRVSQLRSDPTEKVAQRTVDYAGINYNHGDWDVLWGLLNWNAQPPQQNRGWLAARGIKGREVRTLIREACRSNTLYNLGANNDNAYHWIQQAMKGLTGLTAANVHDLAPGGMLSNLRNEAVAVKGFFPGGQEFQSMNFEGHMFTTGNKAGFNLPVPLDLDGRNLLNYNQATHPLNNNVIRAGSFPDDSHAEIILLAKVIRYVFESGFPNQLVSIAGRRLPCGHCQQVINRFIMANQGEVQLDYVKPQEGLVNGVIGAQVANPGHYGNALSKLSTDGIITAQTIKDIDKEPDITKRKSWLSRMLTQVINFTPKQV